MYLWFISSLLISTTFALPPCDVISTDAETTVIPTTNFETEFTYLDGAAKWDYKNVVSIRSGNPKQIGSAISTYCFQKDSGVVVIGTIEINYRYTWGYTETGDAATAKVILEDHNNVQVWESGSFDPFNIKRYSWYYNGNDGEESNFSPLLPVPLRYNLGQDVKGKKLHFKIKFTNNDRNVHIIGLSIKVYWDQITVVPTNVKTEWTFSNGAKYFNDNGVDSIRSGNPSETTSATSTYNFSSRKLVKKIKFSYKYSWGLGSWGYLDTGTAAQARLILEDGSNAILWQSDTLGPFIDVAYRHPVYSPVVSKEFINLQLDVSEKANLHFKIEFINNDRNVHFSQSDLSIIVYWQGIIQPTEDKEEICRPSKGRGIGTIPPYCPVDYPDESGLLCYEACNTGYTGVACVCWEDCVEGETDDGAFCRKPLITIPKRSSVRGPGVIPRGCSQNKEYQDGLCYNRCAGGYYSVGPVCWRHCPPDADDHGATCYKWFFDWWFKETYGRGFGTIPDACPADKLDKQLGLCYTPCQPNYYGVGPVCWEYCNGGVDRGALCETQSLEIRAKDSYGRGVGRIKNRCEIGEENDAGLCYKECGSDIWDGVGPVCWNRKFGRALGVIFATAWLNLQVLSHCGSLVLPTILAKIGSIIVGESSFEPTGYDLIGFQLCLLPTVKLARLIDGQWGGDITVAFEVSLSAVSVGYFGGIAFNFPDADPIGDSLDIYIYHGISSFFSSEASADVSAAMVIYRKHTDIPGTTTFFSVGVDIPKTPIGVAAAWAFNGECDLVGMGFSVGIGSETVIPINVDIGILETSELQIIHHYPGDRRRLLELEKELQQELQMNEYKYINVSRHHEIFKRKLLLENEEIENCFETIESKYYARCHSIQTIHGMEMLDIQKKCLKQSECVGYTLNSNTDTYQILSLTECSRNGIEFFDIEQAFYINKCMIKQKHFCDDDGFCELKKPIMPYTIKNGQFINEYYTKCPFNIKVTVNLKPFGDDRDDDDTWYNIFTFNANGRVAYPGLFVQYSSKSYKLVVGDYPNFGNCKSLTNTLLFDSDQLLEISIPCNDVHVTSLKLNGVVICEAQQYMLESCDGKICDIFGSDALYEQANGKIISIKATKSKYIWDGSIQNNNGIIFSSPPNIEYYFHANSLIAPYLQFDVPYLIQMDILIRFKSLSSSLAYNIFEIGFEDDKCTDINDIYLDFKYNDYHASHTLMLGISTSDGNIKQCYHETKNDFGIYTNIKVLVEETKVTLFVNNIESCSIETITNTHQEMVPLIFGSTNRNYCVRTAGFKNVEIRNNVIKSDLELTYGDGMAISDPNRRVYTYSIYLIGVLLLINIICFGVYFYNKTANNIKYKAVSMKSPDTDTDTDIDTETEIENNL